MKNISLLHGSTAIVSLGLFLVEFSRSYSETPQSVGLPWTSDQPVTETCTWQQTTDITDRYPCPQRDSNPQSQPAIGRRSTP